MYTENAAGQHFFGKINDRNNNKPGREGGDVIDERFLNWLTSPINLTICQRHAHALIAVRDDVSSTVPLRPPPIVVFGAFGFFYPPTASADDR